MGKGFLEVGVSAQVRPKLSQSDKHAGGRSELNPPRGRQGRASPKLWGGPWVHILQAEGCLG